MEIYEEIYDDSNEDIHKLFSKPLKSG